MIKDTGDFSVKEIFIRNMRLSDLPKVLKIERLCFTTPWSETAFLQEIENPYSLTKVALLEDEVIGYICIDHVIDECHILNLAVQLDMRRCGVATSLLKNAIEELRRKDCITLTLEVRVSNYAAKKFYECFDFKEVGLRRGYYTFPKEDAFIMIRKL